MITKKYLWVLLAVLTMAAASASAQTYQETDENGEKVYYKIMSAAPEYQQMCMEDNIRNARYSNYTYLVKDSVYDNSYQQWQIIPDTSGENKYYIKNRRSMRFIKTDGSWVGSYMSVDYANNKNAAKSFEIIPISEEQVLIRYTNTSGSVRYLSAADSTQSDFPKLVPSRAADTPYAWHIINANGTNTGIANAHAGVHVSVVNHRIIVEGTTDYEIYDMQGRHVEKHGFLLRGIYIVQTQDAPYKVVVR